MRVVTAAVLERDGKYLICQRAEGRRLAGVWEFPGGKLEEGETPEQGLARELEEELGFQAKIGDILDAELEEEFREFLILYYRAEIAEGELRCLEHADIRYVTAEELSDYTFSSADARAAEKLNRKK